MVKLGIERGHFFKKSEKCIFGSFGWMWSIEFDFFSKHFILLQFFLWGHYWICWSRISILRSWVENIYLIFKATPWPCIASLIHHPVWSPCFSCHLSCHSPLCLGSTLTSFSAGSRRWQGGSSGCDCAGALIGFVDGVCCFFCLFKMGSQITVSVIFPQTFML